jgi:hypothetical protein
MIDSSEASRPNMHELTPNQLAVISATESSFSIGPAGTGKSTALRQRLLHLLKSGEQAYTILVLVSESSHINHFSDILRNPGLGPQSELKTATFSTFARDMISLLWPLIAREAGFASAHRPPTFLGYDLAQLLMWRIIKPAMDGGMFADLRLRPQQIVSQILDTLNRAALNNLTLDAAEKRQHDSWAGDLQHLRHIRDASATAGAFRKHCLENNLLDLSLIVQVFNKSLVGHPELNRYFSERFQHLIVDNIEEHSPAGQNFIKSLIGVTRTAAIAFDEYGGYKRFLGADPDRALAVGDLCRHHIRFKEGFVANQPLFHLSNQVSNFLIHSKERTEDASKAIETGISGRYRRDMVATVVEYLAMLIEQGTQADDIAIITPYLDGALRYSLSSQLKRAGIPHRLMRRLSSPREEPRVRAWITWLALAHPSWEYRPSQYDVAEALDLSISSLDPARAQLVSKSLYDQEAISLRAIDLVPLGLQDRLGQDRLNLVEELRIWLNDHGHGRHAIDGFLSRLFNDVLAQPRYQPVPDLVGAAVCDWLVRSAGHLRRSAEAMGIDDPNKAGTAFIESIYQGLVTASPPDMGDPPDPDGLMIGTMYGYLLSGKPVRWQVWLDVGASGWWDIPRQPLSNAFVLTPEWQDDQIWTMGDDHRIRNQLLSRIIQGLVRRCREGVILASSDLDRRGFRQDGPLLRALQPILGQSAD